MTESEAIEVLTDRHTSIGTTKCDDVAWKKLKPAMDTAVNALEKIQQYQAIGIVEKCQEVRERYSGKKPILNENINIMFCPICERKVKRNFDLYCSGCGQKLDWSE